MRSLKAIVANAREDETVSADVRLGERFERKYFVPPKSIGFAYSLLRQVCRPDDEHSRDRVNSLYFDTPDLDYYTASADGEFKKEKVRIRWYGETRHPRETVPVFLELKSRQGLASSKERQRMLVSSERLQLARLGTGIVDRNMLVETLARFGHYLESSLRPIILISYMRYRFIEMLTGMRISLDYDIHSSMVARELGHGERELPLRGGVIEVKGPTMDWPATLARIKMLDVDWSKFSKYCYCIESHFTDPGSVGRLWPAGKMIRP